MESEGQRKTMEVMDSLYQENSSSGDETEYQPVYQPRYVSELFIHHNNSTVTSPPQEARAMDWEARRPFLQRMSTKDDGENDDDDEEDDDLTPNDQDDDSNQDQDSGKNKDDNLDDEFTGFGYKTDQ